MAKRPKRRTRRDRANTTVAAISNPYGDDNNPEWEDTAPVTGGPNGPDDNIDSDKFIKDTNRPTPSDGADDTLDATDDDMEIPAASGEDVILHEDGSATIEIEGAADSDNEDHYVNLATTLEEAVLGKICVELLDAVEIDKQSREKRDKQYEEGIRRTGLGNDAPGGAEFEGASKAVHPMLIEAAIDFGGRVSQELLPPEGPVKDKVVGEETKEKVDRARRVARYMNWQCTEQMPGFYHELEQGFTQCPLGGAFYTKLWITGRDKKKPDCAFIPIDLVHRPYADNDFYSCPRITHQQTPDQLTFDNNIKSGLWRDVVSVSSSTLPDLTQTQKANEKVEGKDQPTENIDNMRTVYEISAVVALEHDDEPLPYLITIDDNSRKMLSAYRNWLPDDTEKQRLDFLIEWPFWPWRGGYPIGMTHMIGGLSGAATGALRALLDSAFLNTVQTGVKLKGGATVGGQNIRPQVGQVAEVQGSLVNDDIRKTYMPLAFPPPSPVLFQLLGFLVDAGRGVVRTTFDDLNQMNSQTPVGTAQMMVEQGLKNFSSIHARLHRSMKRLLKNLYLINSRIVENERVNDEFGELIVKRQDFEGPMTVIPVSDPRIFSDIQRLGQAQAVMQLGSTAVGQQIMDQRKIYTWMMDRLRVPNPEEFMIKQKEPTQQNPVNENAMAVMAAPILAFPDQDHAAHLQVHLSFMQSQYFGMSQLLAPTFLPAMIQHLKEHIAYWYVGAVVDAANKSIKDSTGQDVRVEDLMLKGAEAPLDVLLAQISPEIIAQGEKVFKDIMPIIMQAQQLAQQFAPPQPMDPSVVQMKAVESQQQIEGQKHQLRLVETQGKQQTDQGKLALEGKKVDVDAQDKAARREIDKTKTVAEIAGDEDARAIDREAIQHTDMRNEADNNVAIGLAELEVASGEKFSVSTGTGVDPGRR